MRTLLRGLLHLLPEPLAFRLTFALMMRAPRQPLNDRDHAALQRARQLRWGTQQRYAALAWGDAGPCILLIHGWGGRALQMAMLGERLAAAGYRVFAPDLFAHGASPGRRVHLGRFIDGIAHFAATLPDPLHAMVGHSAGAGMMMFARLRHGVLAEHYVCLSASVSPYPPLNAIRRALRAPESRVEQCRRAMAAQMGEDANVVASGGNFAYRGQGRLLLVNDNDDAMVDPEDGQRIAPDWPQAQRLRTQGLGHHRLMWDPAVRDALSAFIGAPAETR